MTKKLALGLAAALAFGGSAYAADAVTGDTNNIGTIAVGTAQGLGDFETNTSASAAYTGDLWLFTLPLDGYGASGSAAPINLSLSFGSAIQSTVTQVELYNVVGGSLGSQVGVVTSPGGTNLGEINFSFSPLQPGHDYGLLIKYSVGGNASGGYAAQIMATVPEPETYAMLALGLGVVGFVARRRKQA